MRLHVVNGKLHSLQSHDMHVLAQQILPLAMGHVLHNAPYLSVVF